MVQGLEWEAAKYKTSSPDPGTSGKPVNISVLSPALGPLLLDFSAKVIFCKVFLAKLSSFTFQKHESDYIFVFVVFCFFVFVVCLYTFFIEV